MVWLSTAKGGSAPPQRWPTDRSAVGNLNMLRPKGANRALALVERGGWGENRKIAFG